MGYCSVRDLRNAKKEVWDNLEKEGIYIHKALIDAYKKIYDYTSDEGEIRHGSRFEKEAKLEDARYMLISL